MTIYSYLNSWDSYGMTVSKDTGSESGGQKLRAGTGSANPDQFKRAVLDKRESNSSNTRFFLSTTFTGKDLKNLTGYKQYNYDSPWVVPITLVDKKQEAERNARVAVALSAADPYGFNAYAATHNERMVENLVSRVSGYRIELSSKVPDFVWYQKNFNEYSTGKATLPSKRDNPDY